MGTLDTVHAGRTPRRLPFAVRHLDDSSPTVRFTNMANSRLREIRVHFTGRPDLGGIDLLALADFEESSKVRVDDHSSRMGNWASCNRLTLQPWMSCVTRLLRPIPTRFIAKNGVASTPRGDVFWPAYSGLLLGLPFPRFCLSLRRVTIIRRFSCEPQLLLRSVFFSLHPSRSGSFSCGRWQLGPARDVRSVSSFPSLLSTRFLPCGEGTPGCCA